MEFFTGTNPQREPAIFWHVRFEWSWSNSGLGCGQVNAAGKQVGMAERFDFIQQDDDMHVVLRYTQYMISVFVCVLSVQSIFHLIYTYWHVCSKYILVYVIIFISQVYESFGKDFPTVSRMPTFSTSKSPPLFDVNTAPFQSKSLYFLFPNQAF